MITARLEFTANFSKIGEYFYGEGGEEKCLKRVI